MDRPYNRLEIFWTGKEAPSILERLEQNITGPILNRLKHSPRTQQLFPGSLKATVLTQTLNIRPHQTTVLAREVHSSIDPLYEAFLRLPNASNNQILKVRLYTVENMEIRYVIGVSIASNPLETPLEALELLQATTGREKTIDALIDLITDTQTPADIKEHLRSTRPITRAEVHTHHRASAQAYGQSILDWYARLAMFTKTLVTDNSLGPGQRIRARLHHATTMAHLGPVDFVAMEHYGGRALAEEGTRAAVQRRALLGSRHFQVFPQDAYALRQTTDESEDKPWNLNN